VVVASAWTAISAEQSLLCVYAFRLRPAWRVGTTVRDFAQYPPRQCCALIRDGLSSIRILHLCTTLHRHFSRTARRPKSFYRRHYSYLPVSRTTQSFLDVQGRIRRVIHFGPTRLSHPGYTRTGRTGFRHLPVVATERAGKLISANQAVGSRQPQSELPLKPEPPALVTSRLRFREYPETWFRNLDFWKEICFEPCYFSVVFPGVNSA